MSTTTFTANAVPPPDRFRNGDIWRGPNGHLYSVGSQQGLASSVCMLRPCGWGLPVMMARTGTRGWSRSSWGRQA